MIVQSQRMLLTTKFANRNIRRSLLCCSALCESVEEAACFGVFAVFEVPATPFDTFEPEEREVIGLFPCQAFWLGFLFIEQTVSVCPV